MAADLLVDGLPAAGPMAADLLADGLPTAGPMAADLLADGLPAADLLDDSGSPRYLGPHTPLPPPYHPVSNPSPGLRR